MKRRSPGLHNQGPSKEINQIDWEEDQAQSTEEVGFGRFGRPRGAEVRDIAHPESEAANSRRSGPCF